MPNETSKLFTMAAKHFLREYKERGGSQTKLAKELGVTQAYISSVLNGTRSASFDLYSQIANKLHGPLDKFLMVGRRIQEGKEPIAAEEDPARDDAEHLIARLTYFILDHRRIENEIQELKHFYESIVENLQSAVLVTDKNNQIVFANRQLKNICGILPEEVIGRSPLHLESSVPGLCIPAFVEKYQEAYERLEPLYYENINFNTSHGHSRYSSGWFIPLLQGIQYEGMICTLRDTSDSYAVFNLLTETVEHIPEAVIVLQQKTPLENPTSFIANKKFRKIFGFDEIDPFTLTFNELSVIIKNNIRNKADWQHFISLDIQRNEQAATFVFEHINGKIYFAQGSAVNDRQGMQIGRMAMLKEMI